MKIDTRPATSQDVDWLANLFIQSMRDAITATRGFWDRAREDAQFRAQLQITDARVILGGRGGSGLHNRAQVR